MPNKYAATFKDKNGEIFNVMDSEARSEISSMNAATAGDVGKVLSPKTVSNDKVIEWQYIDSALDWLEHNNLDAIVTGKVNMLTPPYTMDDVENGKIIYANGSINDASNQSISPLIPISAGTYGLKTSHTQYVGDVNNGNNYKNGYGFFAYDGTTIVARPSTLMHKIEGDIYVFDVPDGAAYVRFCFGSGGPNYYEDALECFNQWILLPDADDNIDASFFTLQQKKPNSEIDKLTRVDGSYATIRDTSARESAAEALARPITFGRKTCAIFEKVCCIGDSFTAGYIYSSSGTSISNNKYSWVEHIKNATGRDYVNCGISGATTKSWLTNTAGLAKAQLPENKAQAYIVALQINDAETSLDVGTVADIGTSAQTYYGCTSKIIDEIFNINNAAHIFFLTQPKHFTGIHSPYRTAELAVIEWYQTAGNGTHQNQVHLIDLLDYWQLFQYPGCVDSSANGHYTGVGWEYTAEIIMYAWSKYINEHPLLFQDVNLIPYGVSTNLNYVTPEMYGAKGDGVTDDSQAIQAACNANYAVCFASDKTYYLGSQVTVTHDCHLFGGKNTVLKTTTPQTGYANQAIQVNGTLKKTTTLTSDYVHDADMTDNCGNRLTLSDMTNINVGDIVIIRATDQYFNYNRQYYYKGCSLLVAEKDESHLYMSNTIPYDIENTANVTVTVYDAPTAIIENLNFVSDLNSTGSYRYCLDLERCKHSVVKNCSIKDMDNGFCITECVNTLIDGVQVSTTPPMVVPGTSDTKDHYGIAVYQCTNTEITRVISECANSCIDISGNLTTMNTVIRHCNLFGGNRVDGFGMHEDAWNTTLEDCTIGGALAYGIVTFNRCRFVKPNKISDSAVGISYRGSHNPDWAKLTVTNCIFEAGLAIGFPQPVPQNPIQAYDHVIGEVIIRDCVGGRMTYVPTTNSTVLSNTIKRIVLSNWRKVSHIYKTTARIDEMIVENCEFLDAVWLSTHSNSDYATENIGYLRIKNTLPEQDKLLVDYKKGGRSYRLPSGVDINLSSYGENNERFAICQENIASNNANDYAIGTISAVQGNPFTRTISTSATVTNNANGNLVFTRNNSYGIAMYLRCLLHVDVRSIISVKCTLKNTGNTDGASFRFGYAQADPETGLALSNTQSSAVVATTEGAELSYSNGVNYRNSVLQVYLYSNNGVTNSETTIEDFVITVTEGDVVKPIEYVPYKGISRVGDGVLKSLEGKNNIMCTQPLFKTQFIVDFLSAKNNVSDVQVEGVSIIADNVANIPRATPTTMGVIKGSAYGSGLQMDSSGYLKLSAANSNLVKAGSSYYAPIAAGNQHEATFYGLAKAAGDVTQTASANSVGEYTDAAKLGIQTMIGVAQAPWELIKEVTYTTYDTNYPLEITTDNNSQLFALTDIRLIVEIPSQDNPFTLSNYGLVQCWYGTGNYDYFTFELGAQNISANTTGRMGYGLITQENGLCTISYARFTNYGNPISQSLHANPMASVSSPFHLYQTPYVFNKIVFSPTTGTMKVLVYGRKNGSAWVANAATWNGGSY